MIICSCNALNDKAVRQAVAAGASRPREVYSGCGCEAQCGNCTATILSIIREQPAASGRG